MDRLRFDLPRETRAAVCPEHGAFESKNIFGSVWSKCPTCGAQEREREEREQAAKDAKERADRQAAKLQTAGIPPRFVGRSFEGFVAETDAKRAALTIVRDYTETFPERKKRGAGLILAGMPGTGKSHLAAACMQALMPTQTVLYATCLDLIRSVRETWRRDSEMTERQVLRMYAEIDLLVIDEIGVQYGTDGEQTVTFEVLDMRYRNVKPTILITNQNKDGLKQYLGERSFDRIAEVSRWVPFDWESYRPTARKASA
jgi:DNA replication protein DnaC